MGAGRHSEPTPPRSERDQNLGIPGFDEFERLGQGGFGSVWRARQEGFDRIVAIKILDAAASDESARRRFARECQALGSVSGHPNIVQVFTWGTTRWDRPYIVMEYMAGGTLAERRTLTWQETCEVGVKIGRAVQVAHAAGILHRDIKPDNIMLSRYGEPKLGDFGISTIPGGYRTHTGLITASLAHAAPEILADGKATESCDIYSLASALHSLIAGQAPFERRQAESATAMIVRILTQPPPDLRQKGVPTAICEVLEQGLAKEPENRQKSAADFADDLQVAATIGRARAKSHPVTPNRSRKHDRSGDAGGSDDTTRLRRRRPVPRDAQAARASTGPPKTPAATTARSTRRVKEGQQGPAAGTSRPDSLDTGHEDARRAWARFRLVVVSVVERIGLPRLRLRPVAVIKRAVAHPLISGSIVIVLVGGAITTTILLGRTNGLPGPGLEEDTHNDGRANGVSAPVEEQYESPYEQLRERVLAGLHTGWCVEDRRAPEAMTRAAIRCRQVGRGVVEVGYWSFWNTDDMKETFNSGWRGKALRERCSGSSGRPRTWHLGDRGPSRGRVACLIEQGRAWFYWTDQRSNLLAFAYRDDDRLDLLDKFWQDAPVP